MSLAVSLLHELKEEGPVPLSLHLSGGLVVICDRSLLFELFPLLLLLVTALDRVSLLVIDGMVYDFCLGSWPSLLYSLGTHHRGVVVRQNVISGSRLAFSYLLCGT